MIDQEEITEAICTRCEAGTVGNQATVREWAHEHLNATGHKVEVEF